MAFAAASIVGALVTSTEALIAARIAMGAAAAVIFPTTLSIISNTFPERRERAAALGVWGAVVGIGVAAGPVTGGLLLEHFAWGSVFWALVPLALRGRRRRRTCWCRSRATRPCRGSTCPVSGCRWRCSVR